MERGRVYEPRGRFILIYFFFDKNKEVQQWWALNTAQLTIHFSRLNRTLCIALFLIRHYQLPVCLILSRKGLFTLKTSITMQRIAPFCIAVICCTVLRWFKWHNVLLGKAWPCQGQANRSVKKAASFFFAFLATFTVCSLSSSNAIVPASEEEWSPTRESDSSSLIVKLRLDTSVDERICEDS